MKILLVSDIHLGVKNNSEFFIQNTRDFFLKQISDEIKRNDVKQLWVLGDLFDCRNNTNVLVNNVALQIMATLLKTYEELTIHILCGNHDIYYKSTLEVSSLKIFKRFHKRLEIINEIKEYTIGGLKTLVVPWLIKEGKQYDKFMKICHDFEDTKIKKYDLCFGHFEVNGFEVISGVLAKTEFTAELFKGFTNVFTGHFHLRRKKDNIQYLGCPYQLTWNDFGEDKGMTIFDTETQTAEFIKNTISPQHKQILISSLQKDETLLDEATKNIIKLIIDAPISTEERLGWIDKLEAKNPLRFSIVETDKSSDTPTEEVELDESIQKDAIGFIFEYLEQDPLPSTVDETEFKLYMKSLHDKVIKEND